MIPKIIFSSFMALFLFSNISSAQIASARLTFSESTSPAGTPTGTVTFTGLEGPEVQVFEAQIPARTEAACFATRDFSSTRPVGRDRASVSYDASTSSYKFTWTVVRDRKDSCRVLLVGQSVGSRDLAVWQSNYGVGGLSENQISEKDAWGDGSVRPVRYSVSLNGWRSSGANLSVKYPAQDGEVIEAIFPEAANSNFRLLETSFASRSEAECIANRDFTAATPVGTDRATILYSPSSALWYLRNTNVSAPSEPCHALLMDGDDDVDARDYVVWRRNLGTSLLAEGDEMLAGGAGSMDAKTPARTPGMSVTFTYVVTNTSSY